MRCLNLIIHNNSLFSVSSDFDEFMSTSGLPRGPGIEEVFSMYGPTAQFMDVAVAMYEVLDIIIDSGILSLPDQ